MTGTGYGTEPGILPEPGARADHAAWMAYAVSRGMPEDQARGLTRDQLRVRLLPPRGPLGGEPQLERHEQDEETLAARREATRRPWERP